MTNEELRIEIAKAKGWEIEEFICCVDPDYDGTYKIKDNEILSEFKSLESGLSDGSYVKEFRRKSVHIRADGSQWANWTTIPYWSTDMSTAWELVEEIHQAGFYVRVDMPFDEHTSYAVKIDAQGWGDHNPPKPGGWWYADTAPRAICEAYLAWKTASTPVQR